MIIIIIKEFVMSDDKVIMIKILRKKKELRKNDERRMFYTLYFLFIFLRIVELLSVLYFLPHLFLLNYTVSFGACSENKKKNSKRGGIFDYEKKIKKNAGEKNEDGYKKLHKPQ